MKKIHEISTILLILLLSAGYANAQMNAGSSQLLFNVGYTFAKGTATESDVDGYSISTSFEKVSFDGRYSSGFNIAYMRSTASSDSAEGTVDSWPLYIYGKVFFGNPKIKGYLGAGLGVHFSSRDTFKNSVYRTVNQTGIALGIPVGLYFYPSESVFLNLNYVFQWMNNSFFKDDIVSAFNFGLGFQL